MIIFRALSVDNMQKHIKMYEISNKTALLLKQNEKAGMGKNILLPFGWDEKGKF